MSKDIYWIFASRQRLLAQRKSQALTKAPQQQLTGRRGSRRHAAQRRWTSRAAGRRAAQALRPGRIDTWCTSPGFGSPRGHFRCVLNDHDRLKLVFS